VLPSVSARHAQESTVRIAPEHAWNPPRIQSTSTSCPSWPGNATIRKIMCLKAVKRVKVWAWISRRGWSADSAEFDHSLARRRPR